MSLPNRVITHLVNTSLRRSLPWNGVTQRQGGFASERLQLLEFLVSGTDPGLPTPIKALRAPAPHCPTHLGLPRSCRVRQAVPLHRPGGGCPPRGATFSERSLGKCVGAQGQNIDKKNCRCARRHGVGVGLALPISGCRDMPGTASVPLHRPGGGFPPRRATFSERSLGKSLDRYARRNDNFVLVVLPSRPRAITGALGPRALARWASECWNGFGRRGGTPVLRYETAE